MAFGRGGGRGDRGMFGMPSSQGYGGGQGGFNPWMAAGGGLGAGLAGLFMGGGDNPADSANQYLNKIPDTLKQYFNPYVNAGRGALGQLQGQYGNLMNDPGALISRLGAGYQQSPGYQFQLKQGEQAIGNANAAGGMAGTQQHMQQSGQLANDMANQDYQQYLNQALGLYGAGLQGTAGLNQMGFQGSSDLANSLANVLGQQAQYGYAGQAGQNQADSQMWQNLFGGAGALASAFI